MCQLSNRVVVKYYGRKRFGTKPYRLHSNLSVLFLWFTLFMLNKTPLEILYLRISRFLNGHSLLLFISVYNTVRLTVPSVSEIPTGFWRSVFSE